MQYSSIALYAIISFRGVVLFYIFAVWELLIPPRIHVFLWLLFHNKLMTRDNLEKRKFRNPKDRVFCSCNASIEHMFFDCIVAKQVWGKVSEFFGRPLGSNVTSIACLWAAGKSLDALNTICAAVLGLVEKQENIVFNGVSWISLNQIWCLVIPLVRKRGLIYKDHILDKVEQFC